MKTIVPLGLLASASAFEFDCDFNRCSISGGPFKFKSKYVGSETFTATEVYNFEYDFSINFAGLKDKIPPISVQSKGGPSDNGLYKATGSGTAGSDSASFDFKVNDDRVNLNTDFNGISTDMTVSGGFIRSWLKFQVASLDPTLKYEQVGPGSDKYIAEFEVKEFTGTEVVLASSAFVKQNGKRKDLESKLSIKRNVQLVRGSHQLRVGLTNNYSINGKKGTYAAKLNGKAPDTIFNENIASKFSKPLMISFNDNYCRGHSNCNVPKIQPQLFFKLHKTAGRLQAAFGSRFFNILPPRVILSMKANPKDSVAPLLDKIYQIDGLQNCDVTGLINAEKPADFIKQNKDNSVCIRAVLFPDQFLDVLDREHGLNCDTVFSTENIDIESSLTYNGFSYPASAIDVCKQSVAEIKARFPEIRNYVMKFIDDKTKQDIFREIENAF